MAFLLPRHARLLAAAPAGAGSYPEAVAALTLGPGAVGRGDEAGPGAALAAACWRAATVVAMEPAVQAQVKRGAPTAPPPPPPRGGARV